MGFWKCVLTTLADAFVICGMEEESPRSIIWRCDVAIKIQLFHSVRKVDADGMVMDGIW